MEINTSFKKYLLVNVLGFGLGGLLWGLALYYELPDLEYPFHYLAIISMALFGGMALIWPNWHYRNITKSIMAGLLGWTIGFIGVWIFSYYLYLYGGLFLVPLGYIMEIDILKEIINLEPDIGIGSFWLMFLIIGSILGFFYAIFLRVKIWPLVWRAGIGLGLASLISPVIGNLIGNAFNSLLLSYLITFSLMGIILGKFISWGIYKYHGGQKK